MWNCQIPPELPFLEQVVVNLPEKDGQDWEVDTSMEQMGFFSPLPWF